MKTGLITTTRMKQNRTQNSQTRTTQNWTMKNLREIQKNLTASALLMLNEKLGILNRSRMMPIFNDSVY